MKKEFYAYDTFLKDCYKIANLLKTQEIDTIIAIARGGVTFGHFLSSILDIRQLYTINAISYNNTTKLDTLTISNIPNLQNSKKVLICDDIIDSGDTMYEIINILKNNYPNIVFETISLFYKTDAKILPTYKLNIATCWIEFFWEQPIK